MTSPSRNFQTRVLPWLLVAGLAVAVVVLWTGRERPTAPPAGTDTADAAVTPRASAPAVVVPTQASARVAIERMQQKATARRAATQQRVDATHALLGQRYANERVDPAWAAGKEQELASLAKTEAMTAMNANVSNLTVDCRTTMCEIGGDFPSITAGDDWFTLFTTNVGSKMPSATYKYEHKADGTVRIHIYGVGRR